MTKTCRYIVLTFALLGLTPGFSYAAEVHWTGNAGHPKWADPRNWDAEIRPGDTLVFNGTGYYVQNDFPPGSLQLEGLIFKGYKWIVAGNRIQLGRKGVTLSRLPGGGRVTVALDIEIAHPQTVFSSDGHLQRLTITGRVSGEGGISSVGKRQNVTFTNPAGSFQGDVYRLQTDRFAFQSIANRGQPSALGSGSVVSGNTNASLPSVLAYEGFDKAETDREIHLQGATLANESILKQPLVLNGPVYLARAGSFSGAEIRLRSGVFEKSENKGPAHLAVNHGVLTLDSQSTHSGNTVVKNGVFRLTSRASINMSPQIILVGSMNTLHPDALDVSQCDQPFIITTSQTLSGRNAAAVRGNLAVKGTLQVGEETRLDSFVFRNTLRLEGTTVIRVNPKDGTSDLLHVEERIQCGGILNVKVHGPNAFTAGQEFKLWTAPRCEGRFSEIKLPDLSGNNLAWDNSRLYSDGVLTIGN